MVIEENPIKHKCNVFDFIPSASGQVACYCAICKMFICYIQIDVEAIKVKKEKKIYPSPENATYNPFNLELWK